MTSSTSLLKANSRSLKTGQLPRAIEPLVFAGALIVSAALVAFSGDFSVTAWVCLGVLLYLVAIVILSSVVENRRQAVDRLVRGLVTVAVLLALIPLASTLITVFARGLPAITWNFITQTTSSVFNPDTYVVEVQPGALQAIVGTLITTGIAAVISVPIGILTAVYLVEYAKPGAWMPRSITFLVDVMTGIPSIVAGLFAFSLFSFIVGPKAFSGFSAAIALSVLMIPIVVRSTEEMLRLVSPELREASLALGVTKFHTIIKIVIPTAIAGIITGVMLAIARVIGETAPIFMAASFTDNFNSNPFDGAMQTLPVMAYTAYKFATGTQTQIDASVQSAWGAALLLVFLVIILNLIARVLAKVLRPKGLN